MGVLYKKHNYINKDINIITDIFIREYDLKSAGLNILYNKGIFKDKEYDILLKKEKFQRNYLIGKFLQNNPYCNKILMDTFIEIRKKFFELNNLEDTDILSIKKDAIFTIDKECKNLEFDNYQFVSKGKFTNFVQFNQKEFYYNKYTENFEIKGYSEETKNFQKNYYFNLLKNIIKLSNKKDEIFKILIEIKSDLLEYKLPLEYYKDIDSNMYLFKFNGISLIGSNSLPNDIDKKILFINNNVSFINTLCNIYL